MRFNKTGTVISILQKKKKNAFLLSLSIYYKVALINHLQVSTIGKIKYESFVLYFFIGRFADTYKMNGKEYRTLTKVYGLRFVISISGKGRRFDIVQLFFAVGMCCRPFSLNLFQLIKVLVLVI